MQKRMRETTDGHSAAKSHAKRSADILVRSNSANNVAADFEADSNTTLAADKNVRAPANLRSPRKLLCTVARMNADRPFLSGCQRFTKL